MKLCFNLILSKSFLLLLLFMGLFSACDRTEAVDPIINLTLSSSNVRVGEEITLTINHNTNSLSVYTGDSTHNYFRSADFLLAGKSNKELQDSIYLPVDSNSFASNFDFTSLPLTATSLLNGAATVTNISKNINLFPSETDADLIEDDGKVVLRFQASPGNWARALRIYPNMKLGGNKKCVTRLRFLHTNMVKKSGSTWVPLENTTPIPFSVVTRISGIAAGENVPSEFLSSNLAAVHVMTPDTNYQDQSFDLTQYIDAWENSTGKHMDKLVGIQFFFSGSANAAYDGKVLIQSITVGGKSYFPFDQGVNLPVLDNSGISTYKYSFSKVGNYDITVVGSTYGNKMYSGKGYQTNRGDNINAGEFDSKSTIVVVPINVNP